MHDEDAQPAWPAIGNDGESALIEHAIASVCRCIIPSARQRRFQRPSLLSRTAASVRAARRRSRSSRHCMADPIDASPHRIHGKRAPPRSHGMRARRPVRLTECSTGWDTVARENRRGGDRRREAAVNAIRRWNGVAVAPTCVTPSLRQTRDAIPGASGMNERGPDHLAASRAEGAARRAPCVSSASWRHPPPSTRRAEIAGSAARRSPAPLTGR